MSRNQLAVYCANRTVMSKKMNSSYMVYGLKISLVGLSDYVKYHAFLTALLVQQIIPIILQTLIKLHLKNFV